MTQATQTTDTVLGALVIVGLLVGWLAHRKGYSFWLWLVLGTLFSGIALVVILIRSPQQAVLDRRGIVLGTMKRCPHCAEVIKAEANVCRHCGRAVYSNSPAPA